MTGMSASLIAAEKRVKNRPALKLEKNTRAPRRPDGKKTPGPQRARRTDKLWLDGFRLKGVASGREGEKASSPGLKVMAGGGPGRRRRVAEMSAGRRQSTALAGTGDRRLGRSSEI
jgi:hypothetical protein